MIKFAPAACIMLAFVANSAQALDSAAPMELTETSVPPAVLNRPVAFPASTSHDTTVLVMPVAENDTTKRRPVIVVQLQPAESIIDQAPEHIAPQQYDSDWESRRQDRLARFMELAARNVATPKPAPQVEPQRVRFETAPSMNVFASNYGYGLGFGWPLHY